MELVWLTAATLLAIAGAVWSWHSMHTRSPGPHALWFLAASFGCQLLFLQLRGEQRASCPLNDPGEILVFLSASFIFFYLVTGSAYQISLLGLFTAPLVSVLLGVALIPGVLDVQPEPKPVTSPWSELHAALSVLSYGALGLAAVAGLMILILDHQLKAHHPGGDLTEGLPSVRQLAQIMPRLTMLGVVILTFGTVAGFLGEPFQWSGHLVVAMIVWLAYCILLFIHWKRGMPARYLATALLGLFLASLFVFAKSV